jgi:hypothetical protein
MEVALRHALKQMFRTSTRRRDRRDDEPSLRYGDIDDGALARSYVLGKRLRKKATSNALSPSHRTNTGRAKHSSEEPSIWNHYQDRSAA